MSAPTSATQPVKTKSKAYSSTVAIQGDAAKYRLKYKELKKKVREIEVENDKLHLQTLAIKRNIQRTRLERAILYECLEVKSQATPGVAAYPPPPQHYELDARRDDPYAPGGAGAGSSSGLRGGGAGDYAGYDAADGEASGSAYRQPGPSSASAAAAAAAPSSRAPYGSTYDDYPPPPPPPARSHPNTHARPYASSSSYDSRHHSPQPAPPASSTGDRAERLRQYTESPSPEPASRRSGDVRGGATPPPAAGGSTAEAGGLSSSASRSNMKVTLRRGA